MADEASDFIALNFRLFFVFAADNRVLSKEERETERRRQLKAIRKKYGLEVSLSLSLMLSYNCVFKNCFAFNMKFVD